jgi:hypothetical protein
MVSFRTMAHAIHRLDRWKLVVLALVLVAVLGPMAELPTSEGHVPELPPPSKVTVPWQTAGTATPSATVITNAFGNAGAAVPEP